MEFYIKKNATLPKLKFSLVRDGRSDFHKLDTDFSSSTVSISLVDSETGFPVLTNIPTNVYINPNDSDEVIIEYQFNSKLTKKEGRYSAEFVFENYKGSFVLPLREKLFINVVDSFVSADGCCGGQGPVPPPVTTTTTTLSPQELDVNLTIDITPGSVVFDFNKLKPTTREQKKRL